MKKLLLLGVAAMVMVGCSSEFYKHDTIFKTNQHWAYSWWGHKNTSAADAKLSATEGWWGKEIPYMPAK